MPDEPVSDEESQRHIDQVKSLFAKALSTEGGERSTSARIAVKQLKKWNLAFELPNVEDRNRVVQLINDALGTDDAKAGEAALKLAVVAKHYPLVDMSRVGVPWRSVGHPPPPSRPEPPWWEQDMRVASVRPTGTPKPGHAQVSWTFFEQAYRDAVRDVPKPSTPAAADKDLRTFFESFERMFLGNVEARVQRARQRRSERDAESVREATRAEAEKILSKISRMAPTPRANPTPAKKKRKRR